MKIRNRRKKGAQLPAELDGSATRRTAFCARFQAPRNPLPCPPFRHFDPLFPSPKTHPSFFAFAIDLSSYLRIAFGYDRSDACSQLDVPWKKKKASWWYFISKIAEYSKSSTAWTTIFKILHSLSSLTSLGFSIFLLIHVLSIFRYFPFHFFFLFPFLFHFSLF